jgi:two-component system, chemotaxis family, sensor kinase CheA
MKTIEREFQEACKSLSEKSETPGLKSAKLTGMLDQLREMDQTRTQKAYESRLKQLKTNEIILESLFKSFTPWLQQAARTNQKEVLVDLDVSTRIPLLTETTAPIQTILVHLLRNALFHGIETPRIREALGKNRIGTIQMSAVVEEGFLVITVSDDGKGLPDGDDVGNESFHSAFSAIFASTDSHSGSENTAVETSIYATTNTQTGLGVGLHIVRSQIENLDGSFELKSIPGIGTSAIARLPFKVFREQGDE